MKRISFPLLVAVSGVAALWAAETKISFPPETARFKPGPGAELATAQCLICHSADYVSTQPPGTRQSWQASVVKMKEKYGAPIPLDQIPKIVEYLAQNYGATNQP